MLKDDIFFMRLSKDGKGVSLKDFLCMLCKVGSILLYTSFSQYSWASEVPQINLSTISSIESSGNPGAIGDHGRSRGLYQISKAVIDDYNRAHNTSYLHQDALDQEIGKKVASWYFQERIPALLKHFKKPVTLENLIVSYNCGIGCVVKGRVPPVTRAYIKKYKEAL